MSYRFLISHLTLEEKASLMSGADMWHTKQVKNAGIPDALMCDGPHGLRKVTGKSPMPGKTNSVPSTCYPTASALANSWDTELLEKIGRELGLEAVCENVSILLGPGMNIKRNPLCGRNFEYFSEDPFLTGKLGAAMIRGIQSNGIYACPKHFAANSQEHLRMSIDSVVDERTLREIYLPAFEAAVKEGGAKCIMTSYNRLNGTYSSENTHLLTEILEKEWKYSGMVVTDWGANNDRIAAVKAGCTLEMPSSSGVTDRQIVEAVRSGKLDESILDEQVEKLLDMVFSTRKAFTKPYLDKYKHHLTAAEAAAETAVLLKNEDRILPISKEKRVAVIGDFVEEPRYQGAGSSLVNAWNPLKPLECLKKSGVNVIGFARGYDRKGKRDAKKMKEAVGLAREADLVLLYMGLDEGDEAEGVDRENILLPSNQILLLRTLASVNPNIVVVLNCGGVVDTQWDSCCKALVHGFLSGQAAPLAMAELLTGKRNFSGKLTETFPLCYEDEPSAKWFPGKETTAEYREGVFVGYRYFDTAGIPVKYPFGYGLSYTDYEYSNLQVDENCVRFRIKNTGNRAGDEVAQLYVSPGTRFFFRPNKELKGFCRIHLEPGEEKEAEILLDERSFAVWNTETAGWTVIPGKYSVLIGASCDDIRLGTEVEKNGPAIPDPYTDEIFAAYRSCEPDLVSDGAFQRLLGRPLPSSEWDRTRKLDRNDTVAQGAYLSGGPGRWLYSAVNLLRNLFLLKGNKMNAANTMFVLNATYRSLSRMSGRALDDNAMDALMSVINREEGAWKDLLKSIRKGKPDEKTI